MKTRSEALRDLGRVIAEIEGITARLSAREAAERAWHPSHALTLDELESAIAEDRASVDSRA